MKAVALLRLVSVRAFLACVGYGLAVLFQSCMALAGTSTDPASLPTIAVLDLDLIDTSGEVGDQRDDHARRLAAIATRLR
jgi:hypothetical protein